MREKVVKDQLLVIVENEKYSIIPVEGVVQNINNY